MAAAENLKKKISLLMATRDDAIDRGDVLDSELTDMKAQLLKADFEQKELERRLALTQDEIDSNYNKQDIIKAKCDTLSMDDQNKKLDIQEQVDNISALEEEILAVDAKFLALEEEYNSTMEDIHSL